MANYMPYKITLEYSSDKTFLSVLINTFRQIFVIYIFGHKIGDSFFIPRMMDKITIVYPLREVYNKIIKK